jgi:GDP/UDP-N,N'-diacetylbacillosamine 2-epimerase (hydrolysing)
MKKRSVLGVTGIRSDYDILSSVFKAIQQHPGLELELIVTGAHLSHAFGYTVSEIEKDGFAIADKILSLISSDNEAGRIKGLGIQISDMVQTVSRVNPDLLLVLGDREEAMSTALVGAYLNIPVAHLCGGDRVVGNVDDQVRHAVTKLAHLHFVTNQDSFERVIRLGEQPFRVFNVGNPGLDRLLDTPELSKAELFERLEIQADPAAPYIVLIQHPLSSEVQDSYSQMRRTLEAVEKMGILTILISPNSDAGSHQIRKAIGEFDFLSNLVSFANLPRLEFVNLLRHAMCLLGNSSAGILEAPILKLPVVNVGNRQKQRLTAGNVEFVPHEVGAICRAVEKAVYDTAYRQGVGRCGNPYGDGQSSQRIADILASVPINSELLIKEITY